MKFDGFRILAFREGKTARLLTRTGNQLGDAFPEIIAAVAAIPKDCVLDCELTIPDAKGRPDWHALRSRAVKKRPAAIVAAAAANPAILYAFDLLAIGKRDLRPAQLGMRRAAMLRLITPTAHLQRPDLWNNGVALLQVAVEHGLEGVVGKRLDSPYVKGRSDAWLKVRASTAREQSRR